MKERFKFRAWDNTYKRFIFRTLIDAKEASLEWEQCVGLKDKNGKLIYEGDIVKIDDDWDLYGMMSGEKREVYFNKGGFRLKPQFTASVGVWLEDTGCLEVIGNIHENPELLEQEDV